MGSVSQESSVQRSPELASELEPVTDEESASERNTSSEESDDNAPTVPLSIAESIDSGEDYNNDPASLYTSDEHHNEDSDLESANSQVSAEQELNRPPLGIPRINHSVPGAVLPRPAKIFGKLDNQFYKNITISDDQSAGSEIEDRNLLALRDRTNKGPVQQTIPQDPINAATAAAQQRQFYQYRQKRIAEREAHRLKMAQRKKLEQYRSDSASDSASDSTAMGVEATNPTPRGAVPRTGKSNGIDDDTIKTNLQDVLDGADPSQLDLQKLQEYIELLQVKARQYEPVQQEKTRSRCQVIYRIKRVDEISGYDRRNPMKVKIVERYMPFFDHPEWVKGQGNARRIRSNLPLENFDLYLEKNKDIAFIVYRNFAPDSTGIEVKPGTDGAKSDTATHLPQYSSETIKPVNEVLIEAIETLLRSRQEYAETLHKFSESYELAAPYLFVYHSRKSLEDFQNSLPLPAKAQLSLFLKYVTEEYADEYAAAESLLAQGRISPGLVRYLFKPGDILVSSVNGQPMGYVSTSWPTINQNKKISRMQAHRSGNGTKLSLYGSQEADARMAADKVTIHICSIKAWRWAFDGNFQRIHEDLELELSAIEDGEDATDVKGKEHKPRLGERNISDLNVFPMQFASAELVEKCRRRGEIFWKCRTRNYVSYQDIGVESIQNLVDERYMVDLKTYRSLHPESSDGRKSLIDELGPEAMARDEPPDEQFKLLLPLTIKGYNLRRKKWFDLMAERISDVKWNKEAFQNLVIDRKARDLIRALVSNQLAAEKGTDLIMGKGNGLILLLHGGPGTGKTLTAESVAEIAGKPLYRVTCGDVGTKAEDVEKYLESVLHLGKIWGCVVLLDEADVFLEQRSLEDMERNALVSVFLRVLEYYEGILVLTSNRVGTFDEAFKSRIQLALHYPVLGPYQRLRIWENFLNRLESFGDDDKVDIADLRDHLEDLKEEKMNGRQIRNAITTARQYAEWMGETLTYKHLSDVIEVSGRFDQYLDKLNGGFTQDQLAQDEGLRLA